jgi:hypothetical protein
MFLWDIASRETGCSLTSENWLVESNRYQDVVRINAFPFEDDFWFGNPSCSSCKSCLNICLSRVANAGLPRRPVRQSLGDGGSPAKAGLPGPQSRLVKAATPYSKIAAKKRKTRISYYVSACSALFRGYIPNLQQA